MNNNLCSFLLNHTTTYHLLVVALSSGIHMDLIDVNMRPEDREQVKVTYALMRRQWGDVTLRLLREHISYIGWPGWMWELTSARGWVDLMPPRIETNSAVERDVEIFPIDDRMPAGQVEACSGLQ